MRRLLVERQLLLHLRSSSLQKGAAAPPGMGRRPSLRAVPQKPACSSGLELMAASCVLPPDVPPPLLPLGSRRSAPKEAELLQPRPGCGPLVSGHPTCAAGSRGRAAGHTHEAGALLWQQQAAPRRREQSEMV